jgi:GntR family transcriptional regulator
MASIDIDSEVAVYVQIENHVQFGVAAGRLKPGDQLPSVRELSERLEVNPNTVAKAYRDLEVMGIVYTRRGMGVFINQGAEAKCRDKSWSRLVGRLHQTAAEAKSAGMDEKEVVEVVRRSYASVSTPYGEVPAAVKAMAKKK